MVFMIYIYVKLISYIMYWIVYKIYIQDIDIYIYIIINY